MANPSDSPAAPSRPSVFISYASQDRSAARSLRDILLSSGLEVWYDENELGGGDAWDQKIRRQIRECDYFMALISSGTEARKEGYFRREWRLAAERTLDMADDVLFLIPVAIDDTPESGARVPDKFTSVQWLRAPGGMRTPALDGLLGRLVHGDHHADKGSLRFPPPSERSVPPVLSRPPITIDPPSAKPDRSPVESLLPPGPAEMVYPDFPKVPHGGGFSRWVEFVIESIRFLLIAAPRKFKQLPRVLRFAILAALVVAIMPRCSHEEKIVGHPALGSTDKAKVAAEVLRKVDAALKLAGTAKPLDLSATTEKSGNLGSGFAKAGADIARALSAEVGGFEKKSSSLTVIPFSVGVTDENAAELANQAFSAFYRVLVEARGDTIGITMEPAGTREAALARGQKLKTEYLVSTQLHSDAGRLKLSLHLYNIADAGEIFTREVDLSSDATAIGQAAGEAVLAAWRNQ